MVEMKMIYEGELRCSASHGPSGKTLITDAPIDNHGKGESFSPIDLLATALGTCMLTYIGLTADKHGWDVRGTKLTVKKEMVADPLRRVGRLIIDIVLNAHYDDGQIKIMTTAVTMCPVRLSISEQIQVSVTFVQR